MATTILMPALSPTMEAGTLARWHVKEGDTVEPGDMMADIETDKAVMEFEAVDPGVIGKLLVPEGAAEVKVSDPIAVLLDEGETLPENLDAVAAPAPAAAESPPERDADTAPPARRSAPPKAARTGADALGRMFVSPLARRMASEHNLDLKTIAGSGPNGRVVKMDIERALAQPSAAPRRAVPPPAADQVDVAALYAGREFEEIRLGGMRRVVAARLTEAKQTVPHFYLRREFFVDELIEIRRCANEALAERNEKLSINDFIIRACALALQQVPEANSVWAGDRILRLKPSDVAVAVAVEGGLYVPVLRDAETKTVLDLSREMKRLAERARARKLMPEDYTGGTFAISNLGMFGISSFDAVINPPHGSILAVGSAVRKPVETNDGAVAFVTVVAVTLSCDHRVMDGVLGARFLDAIAKFIARPMSMMM